MSHPLKFLLDENIPKSVRRLLESKGLSVEYTTKGIVNGKLASVAKEKEAVLVSRDSDFINNSLFPPEEFFGIIVFVIHPPKAEKLVRALTLILSEASEFKGRLFIAEEERFEVVS
jgi:predicted nuclease of predicted toxin-antitoxin system